MNASHTKVKAWIKAARPRTLPASVSPVLLACAVAYSDGTFRWLPALLCLGVALLAQIASNFANDYFDFKKGADTDQRVGPARAVALGWITPRAMLTGTFITLGLACILGLGLVWMCGWQLLFVGIAIAIGVLAYSAGPYPLAYIGLGDVCVLLFYGVIPVCFTYYVQAGHFTALIFLLSLALGFLSINILVVNNYRDYIQDKLASKRTTIVLFGRKFGRVFYLLNGLFALIAALPLFMQASRWQVLLIGLYYFLFIQTWKELSFREGKGLNPTLGKTARNVFLFAFLLIVILLF